MTTTTVYAEIVKAERNADGDLVVVGKATGPDLDLDQQICDPTWLEKAMPAWFSTGGNIREQHSSIAAGVATDLAQAGDSWMVTSTIVDPVSAKKVEAGVLKGYSVGIKAPRVITDKAAPGGRIVDGQIVEVSLVDRPCNPTCTLTLSKAAKPGATVKATDFDAEHMLVKVEEYTETPAGPDEVKKDYSDEERQAMADSGEALPDGSYPIKTVADAENAIQAIGRASDPAKTKAHIKKRLRALDREDLIPEDWKTTTPDLAKAAEVVDAVKALGVDLDLAKGSPDEDIASAQEAIAIIGRIIVSEAESLAAGQLSDASDIDELLCAVRALKWFMCLEADEEATGPLVDDLVTIPLAAEPDTPKTPEPDATKTASGPDLAELVKAEVRKATEASEERVKTLEAQLAKVLATPVPGGPALTRHTDDEAAAQQLAKAAEAARYLRLADTVTDREMAQYYRTKAGQLTAPASEGARQ